MYKFFYHSTYQMIMLQYKSKRATIHYSLNKCSIALNMKPVFASAVCFLFFQEQKYIRCCLTIYLYMSKEKHSDKVWKEALRNCSSRQHF